MERKETKKKGKEKSGKKRASQERPQTTEGTTEVKYNSAGKSQATWGMKESQGNMGNGKETQLATRVDKMAGVTEV